MIIMLKFIKNCFTINEINKKFKSYKLSESLVVKTHGILVLIYHIMNHRG